MNENKKLKINQEISRKLLFGRTVSVYFWTELKQSKNERLSEKDMKSMKLPF